MMKKGNVTILASILAIALVAAGVGAGTMAYFSDTEKSIGNTFTSGILDMEKVSFAHVAFDNWKPGDTGDIVIELKNTGDYDIKYLVMRDDNYQVLKNWDLGYAIEILSITEYSTKPTGSYTQVSYVDGATYEGWLVGQPGVIHDEHLSLKEFFAGFPVGYHGANDIWDVVTGWSNFDTRPEIPAIAVGHYYKMVIHLQFWEPKLPQDGYQDSSISFDWVVMGTHADKTEIEGYFP